MIKQAPKLDENDVGELKHFSITRTMEKLNKKMQALTDICSKYFNMENTNENPDFLANMDVLKAVTKEKEIKQLCKDQGIFKVEFDRSEIRKQALEEFVKEVEKANLTFYVFQLIDFNPDAIANRLNNYVKKTPIFSSILGKFGDFLPFKFNVDWETLVDPILVDPYSIVNIKSNFNIQLLSLVHPFLYQKLAIQYTLHRNMMSEHEDLTYNGDILFVEDKFDYIGLHTARLRVKNRKYCITLDVASWYPNFYLHAYSWVCSEKNLTFNIIQKRVENVWFNDLEHSIRDCVRQRTVGVPIGPSLVDSLMSHFMRRIAIIVMEKLKDVYLTGITIICRCDNLEIYLDPDIFNQIDIPTYYLTIKTIVAKVFAIYCLTVNYRKTKEFSNSEMDNSPLKTLLGVTDWLNSNSDLNKLEILDPLKSCIKDEYPESDLVYKWLADEAPLKQLCVIVKKLLCDNMHLGELVYWTMKRLDSIENLKEEVDNVEELVNMLLTKSYHMYNTQMTLQKMWILKIAKKLGISYKDHVEKDETDYFSSIILDDTSNGNYTWDMHKTDILKASF